MMSIVRYDPTAELFIANQNAEHTRSAYRYDLNKWFDWLGNRVPDAMMALEFRAWLESAHSSRTAARVFNTIRSYYRFTGRDNPFENIKAPRRIRNATPVVPEEEVVDKMLSLCDNTRDRLVINLLLNGLRAQEVCDLVKGSVVWSNTYSRDIMRVIGKGNKERLVPATLDTSMALRAYSVTDGPLVKNEDGSKMHLRQVQYVVEKWSAKAGSPIRPHALRHQYATRLIRAGTSLLAVQRLLGHESVATTQVYVSLDMGDIVRESSKDPRNAVTVEVS
jgi:site-specific recombinase XerD